MKFIQADLIFSADQILESNKVLVLNDDLSVEEIVSSDEISNENIQKEIGILIPGFVNAHCHLELSHLKNMIPQKTGLVDFIKHINQSRGLYNEQIEDAIEKADDEMFTNGIVAVADISNLATTINQKSKSKIYYHTLVEILGADPNVASKRWQDAKQIFREFSQGGLDASLTLHAPYSCSLELFHLLAECEESGLLFSIHNQECEDENSLFYDNDTELKKFIYTFIQSENKFPLLQKNTLDVYMQLLDYSKNIQLVHNIYTRPEDVKFLLDQNVFMCTCPNANEYIENKYPDYQLWMDSGFKITIGTDSLASNNQLCIWEEIKTILKNTECSLEDVLTWSTYNGAAYMDILDQYGSFEKNKKSGVVLLEGNFENVQDLKVKRLF